MITKKKIFLVIFLLLLTVIFIKFRNIFPSEEKLLSLTQNYFTRYGLIIVLISSFIEGLFVFGLYYPGGIAFFLGIIFYHGDVPLVIITIALATLGFFLSYIFNYILGKYGWYKILTAVSFEKPLNAASDKVKKYGFLAIFFSYWGPNIAALVSTAAGILQLPFRNFIVASLFSVIFWSTFWGIFVYFMGDFALSLLGPKLLLTTIAAWLVIGLWGRKNNHISVQ